MKVNYRTLQRLMDLMPKRTGLSTAIDTFLEALHARADEAITKVSSGQESEVSFIIRVTKGDPNETNERKT